MSERQSHSNRPVAGGAFKENPPAAFSSWNFDMHFRYFRRLPERMVVLSIQLPPQGFEPPAPFGFGAFIVTRRWREEAEFASYARGFGAGYDPQFMRKQIGKLLTPESSVMIYSPTKLHGENVNNRSGPLTARYLDFVPNLGTAMKNSVNIKHDELVKAARIGGIVQVPVALPSPLQRIQLIGTEAEAAWLWWLFGRFPSRLRLHLWAAHRAWRALQVAGYHTRVL